MLSNDLNKRMTWEEIKEKYPFQNVGLVECFPNSINIKSAIVKYTEKDISYDEMIEKAFDGEISMRFTALNKCVVLKQ